MTENLTPGADLATRWAPDPAAVRAAVATLAPFEGDVIAAVPIYQPGKEHGVWVTGQEVVTVHGAVFWGVNSFEPDGEIPSYAWARNQASEAARAALGDRPGTYGYAAIHPDGEWAVFEDREHRPEPTGPELQEAARLPHGDADHFCTPRCAAYPPAPGEWHEHTETGPRGCARCSLAREFPLEA